MKSNISRVFPETEERKYPCLVQSPDGKSVILAEDADTGVVLFGYFNGNKVGGTLLSWEITGENEKSKNFNDWQEFAGTVTLEND